MTKRTDRLNRFKVATPCEAEWNLMTGNEQIRYCNECEKYVYDISKMTSRQAEAILSTAQGPICARFIRLADGSTVTQDSNNGLHLISRRVSPIASALFTAIMGIQASAGAQTSMQTSQSVSSRSEQSINKDKSKVPTQATHASLRGNILDQTGAVIFGANVTLTKEQSGETQTITSSQTGEYKFLLLEAGSYTLKFESPGFANSEIINIALNPGQERSLDVTMEVAQIVEMGVIIAPPQPLRVLYKKSDLVIVGLVGESVPVERDGESVLMRTPFMVSSLLKGEGREPVVYVYEWLYGEEQSGYTNGEKLLLFLNRRRDEEGRATVDGYQVAYRSFKLSEADLSIYVQRIEELSAILKQEKLDIEKIVEWLARCAENPVTRWEGAVELSTSAARLHDPDPDDDLDSDKENDFANLAFAALLTPKQKDRLMESLLKTETIAEGEMELINLIKNRNDARLVPFLVSQLRRLESDPSYSAERLATTLADLLDDEQIAELAEEYCDNVTYEDKEEDEGEAGYGEEAVKRAAREKRSAMLRKFLKSVEDKLSNSR